MNSFEVNKKLEMYMQECSEKTLQSNERGFFLQLVNNVVEVVGKKWINNVFAKLKNDSERVQILFKYEPAKKVLTETLQRVQEVYRKKSASVSYTRRTASEKLVECGELEKALILLSQSVLRAPQTGEEPSVDDGFTLALAYWYRSIVLMKLEHFSEAIQDIKFSIKEGLEGELLITAYKNLAICYKVLDELNKAKICFSIATKMLKDNHKNTTDFDEDYKNTMVNNQKLIKKKRDLSDTFNKLVINEESTKGRFMVAKEYIKTGETIVVESPYAACLLPDFFGSHCHHCFNRLLSPVGCKECSGVAFCSSECRDASVNSYHKYECRFLDLMIGSGMSILSHTALRMITQNSLDKCLEIYNNRTNEKVYQLCTNSDKRSPTDFLMRTVMSCFLLRILQKSEYFRDGCANEKVIPEMEEIKIAELLLYNLQMLQFNAHEIYETKNYSDEELKDSKTVYIGVAVYPKASLFNHDCYPSVLRYFKGKKLVLRAAHPINEGHEVSENYGPMFIWKTKNMRQNWLAGRYWFQCQCLACLEDWPSIENHLERVDKRLRCPTSDCNNHFSFPLKNKKMKCSKCKTITDFSEKLDDLKKYEDMYEYGKKCYIKKEVEKSISSLCKAVDEINRITIPPHPETHLSLEMLRSLYALEGNCTYHGLTE